MAAAKQGKGGIPGNPPKDKSPTIMLIRNEIPAEEFLKAYRKTYLEIRPIRNKNKKMK